jgi:translocation protein SEC66
MASVLAPVLYIVLVFGSLLVFSSWYRKRLASSHLIFTIYFYPLLTYCPDRRTEPYFSSHPDRDVYVTLLGRTDPPANDALLKSALLRRAMADVLRVLQIREDKPALQNLLQKGSIGDDLWNSLLAAERELEAEIMEVVAEANTFVEGWGTVIFQTANEMFANEKMRALFEQNADMRREKGLRLQIRLGVLSELPCQR